MASRKKSKPVITENENESVENILTEVKPEDITEVKPEDTTPVNAKNVKDTKNIKNTKKTPKYAIGSIVFVSKEAEADLNGFKLFPPYKKYTYTVEAYDEITGVYSLRRLNLSLKLKEADIVAPSERAHDPLNRRQF